MPVGLAAKIYKLGQLEVDLGRRELRTNGVPVPLGGRSFDIMTMLVARPEMLVSKSEIFARVWPDRPVNENTLQVHMSALRKALAADAGLIRTESGRGYRLLGEWTIEPAALVDHGGAGPAETSDDNPALPASDGLRRGPIPGERRWGNLPAAGTAIIGREPAIVCVSALLQAHPVVTLAGPGGVGKTSLALALAHRLQREFTDGTWLVELAPLSDAGLVASEVARALGLNLAASCDPLAGLAQALADKQALIVLDNCEHLIDAASNLAAAITRSAPGVTILATSREPLQIEGEFVWRVPTLDLPTEGAVEPAAILQSGAVQLFILRLQHAGAAEAGDAAQLAGIAMICRQLDGIPLAIELAASRAAVLGVEETGRHLDDRFRLLCNGRRTAVPRHQTLRATLDWSHDLLDPAERVTLRRLSAFVGGFTLAAASAVLCDAEMSDAMVIGQVANLANKSLLVIDNRRPTLRYELLETVRAYAREKCASAGEAKTIAHRHAAYYQALFEAAQTGWDDQPGPEWLAHYRRELDNVRAALDWAFGETGDATIGLALAANSVPLMFDLSLISECRRRAARALTTCDGRPHDPRQRMRLLAAVQATGVYTKGPSAASCEGWQSVLDLATSLDDQDYRARALWGLWNDHLYRGLPASALAFAGRFHRLGLAQNDSTWMLLGRRLMGISLHYCGDQRAARKQLECVLAHYVRSVHRWRTLGSRIDQATVTRATLARVLWLQGEPDAAKAVINSAMRDAIAADHTMSTLYVLVEATMPVSLLMGDLSTSRQSLPILRDQAARAGFRIWQVYGTCFEALLAVIDAGDRNSTCRLKGAIGELAESGFCAHLSIFECALAVGQAQLGDHDHALDTLARALRSCRQRGEAWYLPELLRVQADLEHQAAGLQTTGHTALLQEALDLAHQQGALAWQQRLRQTSRDCRATRSGSVLK